ncbi:hypothetical protein [Facklamia languida]|uniref:hypothetical protein n=1 Tax=Facklamia languida TaxID=82347 RepID=UPI0018DDF63B|nr:hypothetical protein [Facklamia languida]
MLIIDWVKSNYYFLIIFLGLSLLAHAILTGKDHSKHKTQKTVGGLLVLIGCVIWAVAGRR